ncbi:SDR family NAD(P)-dependent oxidoreductase [Thermoleophilum album]|uniref:Short-chain dehydrogenase n=1 Tax=Thermoleophilum album TaxID=29539 RepID=A0A1H6FLK2_THEAL|nr:SDR family NAD(P)-dependent oxidoreductase [Thermoleophilum album]SEH10674.1 Short-chain dehydrogenase [Thermoleophilum album]
MKIDGARILLTGATGGLGAAIARELSRRNGHLVLSGRRREQLERLARSLEGPSEVIPADLEQPSEVERLAREAGPVDVLVANAALPASGPLLDFTGEQIDRALSVNLRAPIMLTRLLLPGMVERGRGHLVFMSSLAGKVAPPASALYSATKFGLRGFALGLREDLHGTGVGVTAIFPGFVREAGMFAETGVRLPPGVGTRSPEDVARAVVSGIERGKAEIDVAPLPMRAGARIASVAPTLVASIQRRLGSREIAQRIASAQTHKR